MAKLQKVCHGGRGDVLDRRKRKLVALIIFIIMLNVVANFRWNYNNFEGDMRYKTDRWTNKVWV